MPPKVVCNKITSLYYNIIIVFGIDTVFPIVLFSIYEIDQYCLLTLIIIIFIMR